MLPAPLLPRSFTPPTAAFLNPLLLFGCAAIAAPIIIHLLSRRTIQRTVWAAMRFLQETYASTSAG